MFYDHTEVVPYYIVRKAERQRGWGREEIMQGGEDGSGESKGEVKANGECFELLDKVQV